MFFRSSDTKPTPMIAALIVITLLTALVATEPDAPDRARATEPDPLRPLDKK
jgi:hypothetical protein